MCQFLFRFILSNKVSGDITQTFASSAIENIAYFLTCPVVLKNENSIEKFFVLF